MSEEIKPDAFDLSHLDNPPEEAIVSYEDAVLFQRKNGKPLFGPDKIEKIADKHTGFHGAKARIDKTEFLEELTGEEHQDLVDALTNLEQKDAEGGGS